MKTLILVLSLISADVLADNWYIGPEFVHASAIKVKDPGYNALFINLTYEHEGLIVKSGLGWHDQDRDCPDICFKDDFLGQLSIEYRLKLF